MKHISEFIVFLTLLGLVACGGSSTTDKTKSANGSERAQTPVEMMSGRKEKAIAAKSASIVSTADFLRLSEVRLSPDEVFTNTDLNAEAIVIPPVPEEIKFEYRWFINLQEVAEAVGSTLSSNKFHKQQWILCEARAIAGKKVSGWLKSLMVEIANSPPQVETVAIEDFAVPGQFRYQIKASDVDNDELTYELIAPLDAGIELDKKSGLLTWKIDEKTIEKSGETIIISLSVSDNDAQPTTGALTLHFQKKTEVKNP